MYDPDSDSFDKTPGSDAFATILPARTGIPLSCDNHTFVDWTFRGAMIGQTFTNCSFSRVRWAGGTLEDVRFHNCRFAGAAFDNQSLADVLFEQCDVRTSEDDGALSFTGASFKDCKIDGCRLIDVDFSRADLSRLRIDRSRLTKCSFEGARFVRRATDKIALSDFGLAGCVCVQLSLKRAALIRGDFYGTQFVDCDLSGADFESACLARGAFRNVILTDTNLGATDLRGTSFERTDLTVARDWGGSRIDNDSLNGLLAALGFRS